MSAEQSSNWIVGIAMVVIDGETLAVSFGIYPTNGAFAMLLAKECVVINSANNLALCVATFIALIPATIRGADVAREFVKFFHFGAI